MRKHPPTTPDARSLVHSVSKLRVKFLGAEVNSRGHVYVPKEKVALFKNRIQHRKKYETTPEETPCYGCSKFSLAVPPGEGRGRYRFDPQDVVHVVNEFKRYWISLGAINLEASIDEYLCSIGLGVSGLDPEPHPWVAYLGALRVPWSARPGGQSGSVNDQGSGLTDSFLTDTEIRSAWEADPIKDLIEDEDDEQDEDKSRARSSSWPWNQVTSESNSEFGIGREGDVTGTGEWEPDASDVDEVGKQDPISESIEIESDSTFDVPEGVSPIFESMDEGSQEGGHRSRTEDEESKVGSGELSSGARSHPSHEFNEFRFQPWSLGTSSRRASTDQYDPAPPSRPQTPARGVLRKRDVYLATRYFPDRRCHRMVWQVLDEAGERTDACTRYTRGPRLETAFLMLLAELVEDAALDGVGLLAIRLETNRLSKSLLQRTAAIRAPGHFQAIRQLHEAAANSGVQAVVGAPSAMPASVTKKLDGSQSERSKR